MPGEKIPLVGERARHAAAQHRRADRARSSATGPEQMDVGSAGQSPASISIEGEKSRRAARSPIFPRLSWCRATAVRERRAERLSDRLYPDTPLKGNPIYIPPKGFIEVTKDNEDTKVSPNFRIKEFLTKQKSGYPKYLVLDERLVFLLEAIGAHLEPRGWDADDIFVMSGYRTPFYNKQLDDTKYSLHQWGRAADIFLDKDENGMMDDFNKDKVVSKDDAVALAERSRSRSPKPPSSARFIGGIGIYGLDLSPRALRARRHAAVEGAVVSSRVVSWSSCVRLSTSFSSSSLTLFIPLRPSLPRPSGQIDFFARIVFVPKTGVLVDAEHAAAEPLFERAAWPCLPGSGSSRNSIRRAPSAACSDRSCGSRRRRAADGKARRRLGGPPPIGGRGTRRPSGAAGWRILRRPLAAALRAGALR